MIVLGADEAVSRWVGVQLGIEDFGPLAGIGVARSGKLVAGAVFHNFNWPNIEVSFASTTPAWCTRQTIRSILNYPFIQLDCRRLTAITKATNQPARAFLCRLGFEIEGFHPDTYPDGDAISLGLLRRKCRWIAQRDNLEVSSSPANAA